MSRLIGLLLASSCLLIPAAAIAQEAKDDDGNTASEIVVTARKLDAARDSIQTSVGASQYSFDRAALDSQPGGADRNLKGVLLQAPGVSQDSDGDGEIHIRNEHGNVQYRLNGVIVPQGFAGFGAAVDPRIANSLEVITGALPAQYGYRTSAIIALKTRTDSFDFDGDVGLYGGGNNTIQPSATIRDSVGNLNYFFSGSYLQNDQGISNPQPTRKAIHDQTKQYRGFGYLSYILNDTSRITAFGGTSIGSFQIPNSPGVAPAFTLNGRTAFDSAKLNQNQKQITHFGVAAWQYAGDRFDIQIAPFIRYAKAHFTPDPNGGDLMFNGTDTDLTQESLAYGAQSDASLKLGDQHTLRFGLFYQNERSQTESLTRVFRLNVAGAQASDVPLSIFGNQQKTGRLFGAYLQDEWKLGETLTFNYGLRFDHVSAFVRESQLSPRAGLVWKPAKGTTIHAGYARNFTPPPQEIITNSSVAAFTGTTGEPATLLADPVKSEREQYFDAGIQQIIAGHLTLGIDAYYKLKTNLLDESHFGSTLLESPFNYAKGYAWGVELSASYAKGPLSLYANVARGAEKAKRIISNQFLFDPGDIAYINNHYIFTDHSQDWTVSGGGSLTIRDGIGRLQPSFDVVHGSGLRAGDPLGIIPNGGKERPYTQVNFGIAQIIGDEDEDKSWTIRLDVTNLFDKIYLLHDGSGVSAGQPEYGPRRAVFVGIRKGF
jgi:outer membrane receptor protein involved in Fe transport